MYREIQSAVSFLSSLLYNKIPRRKVNLLAEEIARHLAMRFQNCWFPLDPQRESDFRRIKLNCIGASDTLIGVAAFAVGLDYNEILVNLPTDLSIWINPGEVFYRLGSDDPVQIYDGRSVPVTTPSIDDDLTTDDALLLAQLRTTLNFIDDEYEPIATHFNHRTSPHSGGSLSSPHSSGSQSPTSFSSSASCYGNDDGLAAMLAANKLFPGFEQPKNEMKFTVGTFAQTRFGTTKLRRREVGGKMPARNQVDPPQAQFTDYQMPNASFMQAAKTLFENAQVTPMRTQQAGTFFENCLTFDPRYWE